MSDRLLGIATEAIYPLIAPVLRIGSETVIAASFGAIPLTLWYFRAKYPQCRIFARRESLWFSSLMVACGASHLANALESVLSPSASLIFKVGSAIAATGTLIALCPGIPKAIHRLQQLEVLESERLDFSSTISHELRGPISNIKLAIAMIDLDPPELSSTQEHYFEILRHECSRQLEMVNDLLDLNSLESSEIQFDETSVELTSWFIEGVAPFAAIANKQGQIFVFRSLSDLPTIKVDQPKLSRILSELLNNACKYTPEGEEISASISVRPYQVLVLSVANSGVSLPESEIENIFKKFYRSQKYTLKRSGSGLGLALIKAMVEKMSGTITATILDGTITFKVEIPIL